MADTSKQLGAIQAKLQSSSLAFQKLEGGEWSLPQSQRLLDIGWIAVIRQSVWARLCSVRCRLIPDMASIIEARQRLDSQQSENELVLKVRRGSLRSFQTYPAGAHCACIIISDRLPLGVCPSAPSYAAASEQNANRRNLLSSSPTIPSTNSSVLLSFRKIQMKRR